MIRDHFPLRLHALTSVDSSTSQKVLECLAAGLEHSVRPWESPTKSQGGRRKTVRGRVRKTIKRRRRKRRKGRRRRRRGASLESERRIQAPGC